MYGDICRLYEPCYRPTKFVIIPTVPSFEEEQANWLYTDTKDLRLVSSYTGLNFVETLELDCLTYKLMLRDAFIEHMSQSEEGRDYLEQAWILRQTEPDRKKLRKQFGGD